MTETEIPAENFQPETDEHQLSFDFNLGPQTFALVSEEDFAECMNVTVMTAANWRRNGTGPAYTRIGNKVFYQTKNIYAWLDHRTLLSGTHKPAYQS